MSASAVNMKRLTLELGGKSPDVVFADADMDKAVPGAAMAAFTLTGQFCAAGSRLLVERSIYEEFVGRVVDFGQSLIVGDPLSNATDLGPVVSQEQLDTVLRYVEIGRGEGARLRVGGERLTADRFGAGFFLPPTVFTEVDNDMQISQNEIFGPVLAAMPFDSIEEAISLANSTTYGLASGVWTSDVRKAHHMAAALEAGMVWINTYGNYDKAVPFGGFKMSGIGVENGPEGLEQYLRSKAVWLDTAA
jgi:aldehyde dehydrogenase (NAD+)